MIGDKTKFPLPESGDMVEITKVKTTHPNHAYHVGDRLKVIRAWENDRGIFFTTSWHRTPCRSKTYEWKVVCQDHDSSNVDWEQRRYEIAKAIMPYCAETTRDILMRGNGIGDEYKGKTIPEAIAIQAIVYADALVSELKKGGYHAD